MLENLSLNFLLDKNDQIPKDESLASQKSFFPQRIVDYLQFEMGTRKLVENLRKASEKNFPKPKAVEQITYIHRIVIKRIIFNIYQTVYVF